MTYNDLTARISKLSGVSEESVREVLQAFPKALMEDAEGEKTRTPLGVFTIVERKEKAVRTPDGKWSSAPAMIMARLKPGKKLQRKIPTADQLPELGHDAEKPE